MSKLPHNLSDEELAKILQENQQDTINPTQLQDNISLFVSTFGLEPGELEIPNKLLYSLYKHWTKDVLPPNTFYKKLTQLLPNKRMAGPNTWYLLNQNTIKLNEELYKLVKDKTIVKEKSSYYKKHFDNFLKKCNIEAGTDWVSYTEIYNTYLSWTKSNYKQNPLGKKNFKSFCKLYFKTRNDLEVAIRKG